MKRSQAIHRRLTEEHEQIPAKLAAAASASVCFEREAAPDGHHIISVLTEAASLAIRPANDAEAPLPTEVSPAPARSFPWREFVSDLDPAVVKARYQIGPTDPTILFVGDLDERHGPDLLMRVMPALLKGHAQARLVVVGDGPLLWPLRVMSRYMLLDYAVRVTGHIGGREVRELVAAADIMAVPSRASTEDWQILSAWSARRPVVAARVAADGLCREGEDSLLIEPEAALCWLPLATSSRTRSWPVAWARAGIAKCGGSLAGPVLKQV